MPVEAKMHGIDGTGVMPLSDMVLNELSEFRLHTSLVVNIRVQGVEAARVGHSLGKLPVTPLQFKFSVNHNH